jgi:hypothetical protein
MKPSLVWSSLALSSLVAGATAASAQTPPDVDHYACHSLKDAKIPAQPKFPKEFPPAAVRAIPLRDQFAGPGPGGTRLYDTKKYKQLCAPSSKSHGGQDFPILRPDVHLVELQIGLSTKTPTGEPISQPKFQPTVVTVTDQFRDRQVELKKPISVMVRASKNDYGPAIKCKTTTDCTAAGASGYLCQPAAKGKLCLPPPEGAPPTNPPPPNDVGADNYVCYQVKPPKEPVDPAVSLSNQFTVAIASQPPFDGSLRYDLGKLTKLCAPADKAGENPGAENHVGHLACYQAKLAKTDPAQPKFAKREAGVETANFGRRYFDVKKEREICVPAFKNGTGPTPSPAASPTPTPGPTATPPPGPTPTPTPGVQTCTSVQMTVTTDYVVGAQQIRGVRTIVDYPGPKLELNGDPENLSGQSGFFSSADTNVTNPPDLLNDHLEVGLIIGTGSIPPGQFTRANFLCRAGAAQPVPAELTCVADVSNQLGNPVAATCSVSLQITP